MARPLRIDLTGGYYHVLNRGLERRAIFEDNRDRIAEGAEGVGLCNNSPEQPKASAEGSALCITIGSATPSPPRPELRRRTP